MSTEIGVANHPEYIEFITTYLAINDFVNGSIKSVRDYLRRYDTESPDTPQGKRAWQSRLNRLYNKNLCEPPLLVHLAHLSQEIEFKSKPSDHMAEIIADVDGLGTNLKNFARGIIWEYLKLGRVGVLIDAPAEVAPNKVQAIANGERCYFEIYPATKIRDWEVIEKGSERGYFKKLVLQLPPVIKSESGKNKKIKEVRYEKLLMFEYSPTLNADGTTTPGYTFSELICNEEGPLFDYVTGSAESMPDEYAGQRNYTVDKAGSVVGSHIPFVIMGQSPLESILKDVWELNYAALNLNSTLTNIIYYQAFQRILLSGVTEDEAKYLAENIAALAKSPDAKVWTIEPGNPDAAFRELANIENQARRRGMLENHQLLNEDSKESPSAESKAKDMLARGRYYHYVIDLLTDTLNRIFDFAAQFEGEEESPDVVIGRDFGLEDPAAEQSERALLFQQAAQIGASKLQKAIVKESVRCMKLSQEEKDAIIADIDAAESNQQSGDLSGFIGANKNQPPQNNEPPKRPDPLANF